MRIPRTFIHPERLKRHADEISTLCGCWQNEKRLITARLHASVRDFRYPSVTADSGYESEEGYTYLLEQKQKSYIKPQTYEERKKRSFKKDISKRGNMGYDETTDISTCHAGKKLRPLFIKKQKRKSGYESEVTVYECKDCTDCPYKEKCTKARGNKRLYISKSFLEQRQESFENIQSKKGIQYRMNRSIQVEGAFGVLKSDYEFQRFLLRGKMSYFITVRQNQENIHR